MVGYRDWRGAGRLTVACIAPRLGPLANRKAMQVPEDIAVPDGHDADDLRHADGRALRSQHHRGVARRSEAHQRPRLSLQ